MISDEKYKEIECIINDVFGCVFHIDDISISETNNFILINISIQTMRFYVDCVLIEFNSCDNYELKIKESLIETVKGFIDYHD